MTARRTRDDSRWGDLLIAVGAAALTFSGHKPSEVARRAESVATGLHRMRARLEDLAEQHVKGMVGCKLPDTCDCLLCTERAGERPS